MVLWRVRFPPILPTKQGDHKNARSKQNGIKVDI